MLKNSYKKVLAVSFLLVICQYLAAETFDNRDIGRIVYFEKNAPHFLVIDEAKKKTVICHEYNKDNPARFTKPVKFLHKLNVFENRISPFELTTDTILNHRRKPYLMTFARTYFADNERIKMLIAFNEAENDFYKKLKKTTEANKKIKDIDDRLDALHGVLNDCNLLNFAVQSLNAGDWMLALYIYERYRIAMVSLQGYDRNYNSVYKDIRDILKLTRQEILKKFHAHLKTELAILEDYKRICGEWQQPEINNFNDLWEFYQQCQKAFDLYITGEYRPLDDFQKWSENMIKLLLINKGMPLADELLKNFEKELKKYEKRNN